RAQQDREGRGSRHRAAQREAGEVRAEQIKLVLGELEARAERHVGRIDHQKRMPSLRAEIAERVPAEEMPVVIFRRQVYAAELRRREAEPVDRREIGRQQTALNVSFEESRFEISEDAVAVESVVSGGETAR